MELALVSTVNGARAGRPSRIALAPGAKLTVGRDDSQTISLSAGHISRRHAVIHVSEDGRSVRIEDVSRKNGCRVQHGASATLLLSTAEAAASAVVGEGGVVTFGQPASQPRSAANDLRYVLRAVADPAASTASASAAASSVEAGEEEASLGEEDEMEVEPPGDRAGHDSFIFEDSQPPPPPPPEPPSAPAAQAGAVEPHPAAGVSAVEPHPQSNIGAVEPHPAAAPAVQPQTGEEAGGSSSAAPEAGASQAGADDLAAEGVRELLLQPSRMKSSIDSSWRILQACASCSPALTQTGLAPPPSAFLPARPCGAGDWSDPPWRRWRRRPPEEAAGGEEAAVRCGVQWVRCYRAGTSATCAWMSLIWR